MFATKTVYSVGGGQVYACTVLYTQNEYIGHTHTHLHVFFSSVLRLPVLRIIHFNVNTEQVYKDV